MLFKNISYIDENYEVQAGQNILTEGKEIIYCGPELPVDYSGATYDGKNKLAMPGFYNMHCHVPMTLLRGHGEGLPLHRWLTEKMFPFEARLTDEDIYWGAMLGAIELIKSGVVSFTEMYFAIDEIVKVCLESGLKVNVCHGISLNPDVSNFKDLRGYKDSRALYDFLKHENIDSIKLDIGLHAEYTSDENLVLSVANLAKELDLNIHTHISETKKEHENCKAKYNLTPVQYFQKLGLFDQPVTAAHCVYIEGEDFDILREKQATAVHNISSNLKLGSGFAPIKEMLARGVNVSLGTDGASSNNNLNMLEEIHLAAMVNKGVTGDPEFLSVQDILQMATLNGAKSQGREECGVIKEGKRADIIIFDLDRPHLHPIFDVRSNIIYSAQADDIVFSMIDGRVVYQDGEFTSIDVERTMFEADRIKDRILTELK